MAKKIYLSAAAVGTGLLSCALLYIMNECNYEYNSILYNLMKGREYSAKK